MATRQVTLRFMSSSTEDTLEYTHTFPAQLCVNLDDTSQKPDIDLSPKPRDTLIATASLISAIGTTHSSTTASLCERNCDNCDAPRTHIMQTPMTVLHLLAPTVAVTLAPVCDKEECTDIVRREIFSNMRAMRDMFSSAPGWQMGAFSEEEGVKEILAGEKEARRECEACGEVKGWRACTRCRMIGYCGKNCQKEDWRVHKLVCRWLVEE